MWDPTHVQVTVQRAKNLLVKGKNNTNDAFVLISLEKERFQTSVKTSSSQSTEWCEECELTIPRRGNTAEIQLTVLHHSFLGVDEFLGQTSVPLAHFDAYERPRNRWYPLHSKPGKKDTKARGELEVKVAFIVKSTHDSLSRKEIGSSLRRLTHITKGLAENSVSLSGSKTRSPHLKYSGSLSLPRGKSLSEEKYAHQFGLGLHGEGDTSDGEFGIDKVAFGSYVADRKKAPFSDEQIHQSRKSPSNKREQTPRRSNNDEAIERLRSDLEAKLTRSAEVCLPAGLRVVEGGNEAASPCPEPVTPNCMNRQELLELVEQLQTQLEQSTRRKSDLEDYLESLLLKVMHTSPDLLHNISRSSSKRVKS